MHKAKYWGPGPSSEFIEWDSGPPGPPVPNYYNYIQETHALVGAILTNQES